jgi:hypothetical protein
MATSAASTATSQAGAATSEPAAGQPAPSPNEMLIVMRVSNWKWGLGKSVSYLLCLPDGSPIRTDTLLSLNSTMSSRKRKRALSA